MKVAGYIQRGRHHGKVRFKVAGRIHSTTETQEVLREIRVMPVFKGVFKKKENHDSHTDLKINMFLKFFSSVIMKWVRCYNQFIREL